MGDHVSGADMVESHADDAYTEDQISTAPVNVLWLYYKNSDV